MISFPERLAALQPFWKDWYLDELLGKGSYGQVYRIKKTDSLGKEYFAALKWLWIPHNSDDIRLKLLQGYSERQIAENYTKSASALREEILVMKRLSGDSHIVNCEDFDLIPRSGELGWDILIRMELLEPLPTHFARGMTVGDVIQLGKDICDALITCEQERIIHRDIKPDNIFIARNGNYKLGDFGVAKQMEQTVIRMSKQGTPLYMAPEVYAGTAKPDHSVDLYSLGLVMHELLNRLRMPLVSLTDRIPTDVERQAALEQRFNKVPIPAPVDGSLALKKVICKACEYSPRKRYSSAIEMKAALIAAEKATKLDEPLTTNPTLGVGINSNRSDLHPGPISFHSSSDSRKKEDVLDKTIPMPRQEEILVPDSKKQKRKKALLLIATLVIFGALSVLAGSLFLPVTTLPVTTPPVTTPPVTTPPVTTPPVTTPPVTAPPPTTQPTSQSLTPTIGQEQLTYEFGDFTFTVNADGTTAVITGFANKDAARIDVPNEIEGFQVTTIGQGVFENCEVLSQIHLPETLVSIGKNAFSGCTTLTQLFIPEGVALISSDAFDNCPNLTIHVNAGTHAHYYALRHSIFFAVDDIIVHEQFGYTIGDEGITLYTCYSPDKDLMIPSQIHGIPVVGLGSDLFAFQSDRRTISIPKTVASIHPTAFYCCYDLEAIYVDTQNKKYVDVEGVLFDKAMHNLMQYPCNREADVYQIPYGVETICYGAFSHTKKVKEVIISDSVVRLENESFCRVDALERLIIPASVTDIGNGYSAGEDTSLFEDPAISLLQALKRIEVAENNPCYDSFGGGLFEKDSQKLLIYPSGCENTSYTIPDETKTVSARAFWFADNLISLAIPDSVIFIDPSALFFCLNLAEIKLQENEYYEIIDGALVNKQAKSILHYPPMRSNDEYQVADGTLRIEQGAFGGANALKRVLIPNSVQYIAPYAFPLSGDGGGPILIVQENSYALSYSQECGYQYETVSSEGTAMSPSVLASSKDFTIEGGILTGYSGSGGDVTVPDGVVSIAKEAFRDCSTLTSITLPNSLTSIGEQAFHNCSGLTQISFPESLTSIGNYAFSYCTSLPQVSLPVSLISISDGVFSSNKSLTQIALPDSLVFIGDHAFYNCDALTEITLPESLASIGNYAFFDCDVLSQVTSSPKSVFAIGDYAFYRCDALEQITLPRSLISIGDHAFSDCDALTQISIFSNLMTSIGDYAFSDCDALTRITLPDSLTSIGDGAFSNCGALTQITLPDSVATIGDGTFSGCDTLTQVVLPYSLISLGNYAFSSCSALTEIILPKALVTISSFTFWACKSLTQITLPVSLSTIGNYAFSDCDALEQIMLPESLTAIGEYTFCACDALRQIAIPASVTHIGNNAFAYCPQLTILGQADSYAQRYARENSIPFAATTDTTPSPTPTLVYTPLPTNTSVSYITIKDRQYHINLPVLDLSGKQLTSADIEPLKYMTDLKRLILRENDISDISILSELTNLRGLYLRGNKISDVSALSGLVNLEILELEQNKVNDISALSSLTDLTELYLSYNQISDINALSGMTNLIGLGLSSNKISDISVLSRLENLKTLELESNKFIDWSPVNHIESVGGRPAIVFPNKDVEALVRSAINTNKKTLYYADLKNIRILDVSGLKIRDASFLWYFTGLMELNISNNSISDVSALRGLKNLEVLDISNNRIASIEPIVKLTRLHTLNASRNGIVFQDYSLRELDALEFLDLSDNKLKKLFELPVGLRVLDVSNNALADIGLLEDLLQLTDLDITNNKIKDISSLMKHSFAIQANAYLAIGDNIQAAIAYRRAGMPLESVQAFHLDGLVQSISDIVLAVSSDGSIFTAQRTEGSLRQGVARSKDIATIYVDPINWAVIGISRNHTTKTLYTLLEPPFYTRVPNWQKVKMWSFSGPCRAALFLDGTVKISVDNKYYFADVSWLRASDFSDLAKWENIVMVSAASGDSADYPVIAALTASRDILIDARVFSSSFDYRWGRASFIEWPFYIDLKGEIGTIVSNYEPEFDISAMSELCAIYYQSDTLIGLKKDGTVTISGKMKKDLEELQTWDDIVALSFFHGFAIGVKYDGTVITNMPWADTSDWKLFDEAQSPK